MAGDYDGLRSFLRACEEIGEVVTIEDADWNLEISTLTEAAAEHLAEPPAIIFDKIKGYEKGFRVLSIAMGSPKRAAIALGLPLDKSKMELVRLAAAKFKNAKPTPPAEVADGPVMENTMTGNEVDLFKFPSLFNHSHDSGRYIGTGDTVIHKDPDSDYVNVGTYRMQIHESNLLGLMMSPGQHGEAICKKYWERGEACPVVATFGSDPVLVLAGQNKFPYGFSEFEAVGGLMGQPLEVIKGPHTGLPIPAHAEIAIEGEIPPFDQESRMEGPFGEYTGYYTGGVDGSVEMLQPVIRVKAIHYRNNPIILNWSPMWRGAQDVGIRYAAGFLWDQLESAGIQGIEGVYSYHPYFFVIAIKQRYPGHARQVGMTAMGCPALHRNGRYLVIVDEDIDITKIQEVLWAMDTRVDPITDIQIMDGCWSSDLDPRLPPEKRAVGDYTNSRAIYYAVRPHVWRDRFPRVNRADKDLMRQVMDKYRDRFPFPAEP